MGSHTKSIPNRTESVEEQRACVALLNRLRFEIPDPATGKPHSVAAIERAAQANPGWFETTLRQRGVTTRRPVRMLEKYEKRLLRHLTMEDSPMGHLSDKQRVPPKMKERLVETVKELLTLDNPATGKRHTHADLGVISKTSRSWASQILAGLGTNYGAARRIFRYHKDLLTHPNRLIPAPEPEPKSLIPFPQIERMCGAHGPDGVICSATPAHSGDHTALGKAFGEIVSWGASTEEPEALEKVQARVAPKATRVASALRQLSPPLELLPAGKAAPHGLERLPIIRYHLEAVTEQLLQFVGEIPRNMREPNERAYDFLNEYLKGLEL